MQVLHGGLADKKKAKDFSPSALEKGRKVEREHTNDPRVATEIAEDHLTEDPMYYEKLEKMEKKAQDDAFFDELLGISHGLLKISTPLSGRGALLGGAIGAGLGGLKSGSNEIKERAQDDRMNLSPEFKKKLRKKRLAGHASNVLAWGGVGAGIGSMEHKAKALLAKGREHVRDATIDAALAGENLVDHAHTRANQVVQDAPWNLAKGIAGVPKRAIKALVNKIRRKP